MMNKKIITNNKNRRRSRLIKSIRPLFLALKGA